MAGISDSFSSAYIGAYLQQLREDKGRSREEVAAAAGVKLSSISQYERGVQRVPIQQFLRICIFLGYDPVAVVADIMKDNDVRPFEL